ncbi:AI-2E family transporter [Patescibacteria group bacterium]|nr:AI-2E family transporter [Patescibacteria group bacterium]
MFTDNNNKKNETVTVDISFSFLFKILIIVGIGVLIFYLRSVIGILFLSIFLTMIISPFADKMQEKRGFPRWLSILVVYLLILSVVSVAVGMLIPTLAKELILFSNKIPDMANGIISNLSPGIQSAITSSLSDLASKLSSQTTSIVSKFGGILGGLGQALIVFVISFYMSIEEKGIEKFIKSVTPKKHTEKTIQLLKKIQDKVGGWVRGELILILIIGVLSYIGLIILGVNYALLLAIIAGLTELIPYIGPWIGAIPAILIGFTQSPGKAIMVAILYIIIQQLENALIVPKVMNKSVGLHPIVIIIVIIIGMNWFGILGALIAVPVTAMIQIIASEYLEFDQEVFIKKRTGVSRNSLGSDKLTDLFYKIKNKMNIK